MSVIILWLCIGLDVALFIWVGLLIRRWRRLDDMLFELCIQAYEARRWPLMAVWDAALPKKEIASDHATASDADAGIFHGGRRDGPHVARH